MYRRMLGVRSLSLWLAIVYLRMCGASLKRPGSSAERMGVYSAPALWLVLPKVVELSAPFRPSNRESILPAEEPEVP